MRQGTLRAQTWLAYNVYVQGHIIPSLGDVRLAGLTPDHIERLHRSMRHKVSGTTAHHAHCVLASALRSAARHGHLVSPAVHDVSPPRRSSALVETLSRDEVSRLITSARGDPLEGAYILAVTLGMRQGELRGLRWNAIHLNERRLVVRGNATRTLDNQQVISFPKTRAGHRSLRLPDVAVDALRRTPRQGELVWPGPGGHPIPASSFCKRWASMRRRAGIRPINFHALRHTAATLALEDGASPHVVSAMLGHASIGTTLGLYAHVTHVSIDALNARYRSHSRLHLVDGEGNEGTNEGRHEGRHEGTRAKTPVTSRENACRERESNPYRLSRFRVKSPGVV
jgi:integrase